MLEFPYGKHDDMVDAITYLPQIIRKPAPAARNRGQTETYVATSKTGY